MFIEILLVSVLFIVYLSLWRVKKITQKRKTGIDPEVFSMSETNIQKFMKRMTYGLTIYIVVIIILHAFNIQFYSLFQRFSLLNSTQFDYTGFAVGLSGLLICLYAQIKMGDSWRVGIDEKNSTKLVKTGLYRLIRNPTYLGLFILNAGVWIIWPTWTIFIFNLVFIMMLEMQVRCEEDFLEKTFSDEYKEYKKQTKRYIPFIY